MKLDRIKLWAMMALVYLPRRLPVGMAEFKTWSDRIISVTGKFADEDSLRFALASQVIHLGPQASLKADIYFIRSLQKAAANQVASQVFQDIKLKQQQKAEATAAQVAASDGQKA